MGAKTDVPLAPLTTLGLGGSAARMVEVHEDGDVARALGEADAGGEPVVVLGGGSNVVVADEGFPGLALRMCSRGVTPHRDGDRVVMDVAAGEDWDLFVARCVDEDLSGVEALSGIPGLVGATPIQNVGAYGQEVGDVLVDLRAYDRATGTVVTLAKDQCGFGYRSSIFKHRERYVILGVRVALTPGAQSRPLRYRELTQALGVGEGERAPLREVRESVLALRKAKGMVAGVGDPDAVSAGSFFTNVLLGAEGFAALEARAATLAVGLVPSFPEADGRRKVPAAWLVERSGFPKGYGDGAVGVSRKHALALVNRGGGTTRELVALARHIAAGVRQTFGVELVPEPVFVGHAW